MWDSCVFRRPARCCDDANVPLHSDNTTLSGTPGKLDPDKVHLPPDEDLSPAPIEEDLSEWYYLDRLALDAAEVSLEQGSLDIVLEMC